MQVCWLAGSAGISWFAVALGLDDIQTGKSSSGGLIAWCCLADRYVDALVTFVVALLLIVSGPGARCFSCAGWPAYIVWPGSGRRSWRE